MVRKSTKKYLDVKILPKEFDDWREMLNNEAKLLCKKAQVPFFLRDAQPENIARDALNKIKTFPQAIFRVTRQMCECDEECTQNSLQHFDLKPCIIYNVKNIHVIDDYYDNFLIDKKVVNGTLIDKTVPTDVELLQNDIKRFIIGLCNGKLGNLRKLKCKAYELKDHCKEDLECLSELTYNVLPENFRTCKNDNLPLNLSNIGSKIGNNMIFRRIRVSREIKDIVEVNDNDNFGIKINNSGMLMILALLLALFGSLKYRRILILFVLAFTGLLMLKY